MKKMHYKHGQSGAALIVGLLLLVVITVLAVSGMNTATTELAMARNDQNNENAFQAAETGIEAALGQPNFETEVNTIVSPYIGPHEEVQAVITFVDDFPATEGFSLGVGSGFRELHFDTISNAESKRIAGGGVDTDRDASARHTQSFFVIGPELPDLGL